MNKAVIGSKQYPVNLNDAIFNGWTPRQIRLSIIKFIKSNHDFNTAVTKLLRERLKVATGRLIKSLKWDVAVDVENSVIDIRLILKNEELLYALLGEKDLEEVSGAIKIPSEGQLIRYIRAKKKYYQDKIEDIQRKALNKQRKRLARESSNTIHKDSEFEDFSPEPMTVIAREIISAMKERQAGGNAPIKGSEYALLGYWKINRGDKSFFKPRYKKFSTPLYTINDDGNGEINREIHLCIERWFHSVFSQNIVDDKVKYKSFYDTIVAFTDKYEKTQKMFNVHRELFRKLQEDIDRLGNLSGSHGKLLREKINKLHAAKDKLIDIEVLTQIDYRRAIHGDIIKANASVAREINALKKKRAAGRRRK